MWGCGIVWNGYLIYNLRQFAIINFLNGPPARIINNSKKDPAGGFEESSQVVAFGCKYIRMLKGQWKSLTNPVLFPIQKYFS